MPAARHTHANDIAAASGSGVPDDTILAINWESGLGTSNAAILDQNKTRPLFIIDGTYPGHFSVIQNSGGNLRSGFPTPNYLRFAPTVNDNWGIGFDLSNGAYIPAWSVGDGALCRYYVIVHMPYPIEDATHGDEWIAGGGGGTYGIDYEYQTGNETQWHLAVSAAGPGSLGQYIGSMAAGGVNAGNYGPGVQPTCSAGYLTRDTAYRLQLGAKRIATSTLQLYAQVYSSPGDTLLFTHSDFNLSCYSNQPTRTLAAETFSGISAAHWSQLLREWWMGVNGIADTVDGQTIFEWAGLGWRFGQDIDFDEPWLFHNDELTWAP